MTLPAHNRVDLVGPPPVHALFRPEAVAARARGAQPVAPFRVPAPWTRAVVLGSIACVLLAGMAALILRVELVSIGRGMLRGSGSPQIISAETDGTVAEVRLRAGDLAAPGDVFMRLGSAGKAAELLETTRHLELAERALKEFRVERKPRLIVRHRELQEQDALLGLHEASHARSIAHLSRREANVQALVAAGVAKNFDSEDVLEAKAVGEREWLKTRELRAQVREQSAAILSDVSAEEWTLSASIEEAKTRRDSMTLSLRAADVRVPVAGTMGSVIVRPGDIVRAGAPLGRVIPRGDLRSVMAFVPERDRAFVETNAPVQIEVDQFPRAEFGVLHGHVVEVAPGIALGRDLDDTFGEHVEQGQPMCRVQIIVDSDEALTKLRARLRPESLVTIRLTLRSRRVAALFFEPLQRWLR